MAIYSMDQIVAHRRKEMLKPKPPLVEKRECRAYKCTSKRSHSFPNLTTIWCSEHTRKIVFEHQPPPPRNWWRARKLRKESA